MRLKLKKVWSLLTSAATVLKLAQNYAHKTRIQKSKTAIAPGMGTVVAQPRHGRKVRCDPARAQRLDCGRLIAAFPRPTFTRSFARILPGGLPNSVFGLNP